MDTSKAWLWGRIREREREREREGAALVELKAFGRKSGAASCLSCQLLSAVYLLQVFRIHRGGDVKARRGETRECEQLKTVFLSSSPPPPWNFRLFLLRNDNSIGACKWFKCKENRGLLVFFLPRLSFNLRYFQRRLYIRCENKFLPLCFYDRTLLAEFELVYHWWRHLKERSFVFEKSRDERSKSFQSYATISIWRARSVVRVTVYFLRYSLGDRLSKLLK